MKRFLQMLSCALLAGAWIGVSGSCAFGADVTITLGRAAIEGSGDNQAVYFPELTVSSFAAGTYKGILIAFTGPLVDSDEIRISAVDGISENTGCSTKVSKIVKFDGDKNSTQIQNFLRNGVRLRSLKNPKGQKIRLLLLTAEVNLPTIYCDKTQHYYQYVRYGGHKSWLDSYNEAKGSTFMGRRGYLATIASIEEDQFVHKACDGKVGWLGGTIFAQPNKITVPGDSGDPGTSFYDFANDASSKYYNDDLGDPRYRNAGQFPAGLHKAGWYWACGPECGQIFFDTMMVDSQNSKSYNGLTFDKAEKAFVRNEQAGRYFNWRATGYSDGAEPNYGTMSSPYAEPCLTTLSIRDGRRDQSFSWNNIMCNRHDGNSTYQPSGYFIEFGNQPVGNDPEYPAGTVVIDGDVPGLYQLTYKPGAGGGAARTFDMVTGLETNLTALSELGFTAPADRPYFFGWSTDASATAPMYTDAQATLDLSTPSKPLTLHAVWSKLPVVTGEFVDKQYFDLVKLAVRGFSSDDRQYVNCAAYACNAGARASTYAAQVPAGRFDFSVTSDRYVAQGGGDKKRFGDCSLCHAVTNLEIAASCRGPNLSGAFKWGTITEPSPLLPLGQLSLAVPIADYGRGQMIVGGLGGMDFQDTALADSFASIMNTLGTFDRNACYAPRAVINLDSADDESLELIRSAIVGSGGDPLLLLHHFKLTTAYACKSGGAFIEGTPKEDWLDAASLIDIYYAYDCRTNDVSAGWSLWRRRGSGLPEEISLGAGSGEYFELGQGYLHLRVSKLGTFGVVDPTRGEIDFGFAAKNTSCGHDSTWYFPAAKGVGNLVYDRVTFSLIDCGDGAEVNSPAESSLGVPSHTVTSKSLQEVAEMLKLAGGAGSFGFRTPANLDGSYLKLTAERDDGFHSYESTVTFTTVTYTVILYPGYAGPGGVVQTNVFKNSRVLVLPRAEELGYRNAGKYFHYWSMMPENKPVLDDGQSFWDLGDGFTTNNLLAVWSDEPLYRGACPVGANASVDFCNLAGEVHPGLVLGCNVPPYHYVVKAPLGKLYNVRYTSADGVRRLGIVVNTAAQVEAGYDFGDELLVSDFLENGSQTQLLAGGLEFYDASVTARVEEVRAAMIAADTPIAMVPELSLRAAEVDEAARIAFTNSTAIPAGTAFDAWIRLTAKRHIEFRNPTVGISNTDDKEVEGLAELDPAAPALDVFLAFDTGLDGLAVSNTWAVYRSVAGAVDKLTTTPNAAGEYLAVGDGYLQLHLRKLGTLAVHKPVTETTFVLGDPEEVEDGDYAIWKLSHATGSGDRLFSSARLFIPESTLREGWAFTYFDLAVTNHNAEIMFESNSTVVVVSFSAPKTAAEIAELVKAYAYAYTEDELFGSWARLALCTDAFGREQAYVSDPVILPSITALVRFAPGDGATGEVLGSMLFYPDWPGRLGRFAELTNDWTVASGRYFFGWRRETGGDVVFGDAQKIVNGFVIGETNILTAVWTNMPVIAGDVAHDCGAATVSVQSFTNRAEATIFKGGAETDRYALPVQGGRPYNVSVEYRDAIGGEVKSVETVLVTNDVAFGATYDSTGRVATATSVLRPSGDPDFVLVGGLGSITGDFATVVAKAGQLTDGAAYAALTNAVGAMEGVYFDLALATNGVDSAALAEPLTLLLPFGDTDVLAPSKLAKVYRWSDGAAVEVPASEYAVRGDYLELVSAEVAPVALALESDVAFVPGEPVWLDGSAWGWTNMTARGTMGYDRIELTLNNAADDGDRIVFPSGTGWLPAGEQSNVRQVYACAADSHGVPVQEIASNVLGKVRLSLPSNGDGISWTVHLTRADGRWAHEFEVGVPDAWYVVVYRPAMPGAGSAATFTNRVARTVRSPRVGEDLGFGLAGLNFYCWMRNGLCVLDDGQPFFNLDEAFRTSNLDAAWVETPVVSGDCPAVLNERTAVKLVSVGATNDAPGQVLFAGAAPGRYVATAQPGLYGLVYTDGDGLPRTELVELSAGRMTGPDFAADLIATGVDNADAEAGFKLLAGGLRAYERAVYGTCLDFFNRECPDYDDFTMPRLDLVSAKVTAAERAALNDAAACFAVRAKVSMRVFSSADPAYGFDFAPAVQSDPSRLGTTGYLVGTNILVDLIVPFATGLFGDCTNTWSISRRGDDGTVDVLTTTPNAKGEGFVVADGYLVLTVEKFGAFGVKTPDLETRLDLGLPVYADVAGISYFPAAEGFGDLLYASVRVSLENSDGEGSGVVLNGAERYGEELPGSAPLCRIIRLARPMTAAEIAAFVRECCLFDTVRSTAGGDVKVGLCADNSGAKVAYVSEAVHIGTRLAVLRLDPGNGFASAVRETWLAVTSNQVMRLPSVQELVGSGAWTTNAAETVNVHFYGWEYEGEVRFGDAQQVCDQFRIGATNVLTAVWTNMPVIAGDVAHDRGAVTVSVQSFTNALKATIFKGGAETDRYALPMPGGKPYNVAVEYRDAIGGEVKSVETMLVTNDVASGANYDSTGRVATATSVLRPSGDHDFVLVGGLQSVAGDLTTVVAKAGHLTSGSVYVALTNAVGTMEGVYFDLALATNGVAVAALAEPLTLLLPFGDTDGLDSDDLFVYRYWRGAVVEVPASEYSVRDGYLELVTTKVAPVAIGRSRPAEIDGAGPNSIAWLNWNYLQSSFPQFTLVKGKGDFSRLTDAVFLYADRDGSSRLWPGRLDVTKNKSVEPSPLKAVVNGVTYRYVPLTNFREAVLAANGTFKYGVSDRSLKNSSIDVADWPSETEIQIKYNQLPKPGDIPADANGVLGFICWTTGGKSPRCLAVSADGSGIISNSEFRIEKFMPESGGEDEPQEEAEPQEEGEHQGEDEPQPEEERLADALIAGYATDFVLAEYVGWTAKGLPTGLKFNKKTGRIYGTPRKPGHFTVTFSRKSGKETEKVQVAFDVYQGNFPGGVPVGTDVFADGIRLGVKFDDLSSVALADGSGYELYAGVQVDWPVSVEGMDGVKTTLKAKGLPSGLKLSRAKDGSYSIKGVVKKAADKTVVLTASNKYKWTGSATFRLVVHPLPSWAVGTFEGRQADSLGVEGGTVTCKIVSSGKLSFVIKNGLVTDRLTFKQFDGFDVENGTFLFSDDDVRLKSGGRGPTSGAVGFDPVSGRGYVIRLFGTAAGVVTDLAWQKQ